MADGGRDARRSRFPASCRFHPAAVLQGSGPFRWAALSGDPHDIAVTDEAVMELFGHNGRSAAGSRGPRAQVAFPGAARPDLLARLRRARRTRAGASRAGRQRQGRAPIVIGRDHLDSGSVASPNRETEGMKDGSDAIADWPLLNALVNAASGASWVSSITAAASASAIRSTPAWSRGRRLAQLADKRLHRVLTTDPATGILRHADAG